MKPCLYSIYCLRLFRTLVDIGLNRLILRIRYELRSRLDRFLPRYLALVFVGFYGSLPNWRTRYLLSLDSEVDLPPYFRNIRTLKFNFLRQERQLSLPFSWNTHDWPRLWQFYLHLVLY